MLFSRTITSLMSVFPTFITLYQTPSTLSNEILSWIWKIPCNSQILPTIKHTPKLFRPMILDLSLSSLAWQTSWTLLFRFTLTQKLTSPCYLPLWNWVDPKNISSHFIIIAASYISTIVAKRIILILSQISFWSPPSNILTFEIDRGQLPPCGRGVWSELCIRPM